VPGLGDLFVIGRLFGSHNDDKQRSEILLSITPHVLRSIRRPDLMAAEFESGTEANIGAETLRMSTVDIPAAAADGKAVGTVGAAGAASASSSANAPNTPNAPIAPIAPKVAAADAARSANILPGPLGAAAAAMPITAPAGGPVFTWLAPTQIKVGEQFSAVLKLSSQNALRGMPLLVGFDPLVLQVAGIVEGDFFKQGNGRSQFSQRVDLAQGKIFVAAVRQGSTGADSGVNGNASVVTLTFKALKAMGLTRIQLLSATPEPPPSAPLAMPVEALLRITP
jgi:general secretion pathway protein D